MANKNGRRRFGSVRQRSSGRYQARYPGPDGVMRSAPQTFARKSEAERYLSLVEAQMMRGEWVDPARAEIRLGDYAEQWITQRPGLRPRTIQLYRWVLGKHITPYLGAVPLGKVDTALVREWRARLLGNGVSVSMAAKAYRLLRAVLTTAVKEDEILIKNPCRIPGADQEKAPERPVLSVAQVFTLADSVPVRYRALVLLSTFACLRWGEVSALHRQDIDTTAGTVRVRQAYTETRGVGLTLGPPKSRAGRRIVSIPKALLPAIRGHLEEFTGDSPDALVFTGPTGRPIWRGNFNKLAKWPQAVGSLGVTGLHFHDLRHTGNVFAAETGASLRDLMARMGHDSPAAALIYQHASRAADQGIADAVSRRLSAERMKGRKAAPPSAKGRSKRPGKRAGSDDDPHDGAAGALIPVA